LEKGLKIRGKVKKAIIFNQSRFLQEYAQKNAYKRARTTDPFLRNTFKLGNYLKNINIRKYYSCSEKLETIT